MAGPLCTYLWVKRNKWSTKWTTWHGWVGVRAIRKHSKLSWGSNSGRPAISWSAAATCHLPLAATPVLIPDKADILRLELELVSDANQFNARGSKRGKEKTKSASRMPEKPIGCASGGG